MEFIVVILLIVIAVIAYQLYRVKSKIEQRAKDQYDSWKKKDYEYIKREQRNIANLEAKAIISEQVSIKAKEQFEKWRADEITYITQEQKEIAKKEAEILLQKWKESNNKSIREDAIQKSRSVTVGKITEHFIPYLPDFTFNPKDARFVGTPIDLIVFDGLDNDELQYIWFIEVKTGSSSLSKRQRQIRNAVNDGRVKWKIIRRNVS